MEDKTARFIAESRLADAIKLDAEVVVHRSSMSLADVAELRVKKELGHSTRNNEIAELEVGGIVAARGRLVRKGKNVYFRVTEPFPAKQEKEAV